MKLSHFYIAIFAPWLLAAYFSFMDYSYLFVAFLLVYFIYRSILDYHKLKNQKVVEKKDIWKFIVPIHSYLYFRELYFEQ